MSAETSCPIDPELKPIFSKYVHDQNVDTMHFFVIFGASVNHHIFEMLVKTYYSVHFKG